MCGEQTPTDESEQTYDVITGLSDYPPNTLLTEKALAKMFNLCATSIKRAVERHELPPSTKICGKPRWTVKVINSHIEEQLKAAKQESEAEQARLLRLSP